MDLNSPLINEILGILIEIEGIEWRYGSNSGPVILIPMLKVIGNGEFDHLY